MSEYIKHSGSFYISTNCAGWKKIYDCHSITLIGGDEIEMCKLLAFSLEELVCSYLLVVLHHMYWQSVSILTVLVSYS